MTEAIDDALSLGLPDDIIADLEEKEPGFPVWPQNMFIVHAFLAVSTQWRMIALPGGKVHWLGLDYGCVGEGLRQAGMLLLPSQWHCLRVMEQAASAALNGYRG